MSQQNIGIIINGVAGRMRTNQRLMRSIMSIRERSADCSGKNTFPEPNLGKLKTKCSLEHLMKLFQLADQAKLLSDPRLIAAWRKGHLCPQSQRSTL